MRTLIATLLAVGFLMTPAMEAKSKKARVPHAKGVKAHKAAKVKRHKRQNA